MDLAPSKNEAQLGLRVANVGLGAVNYAADTITLDQRGAALFDLPANFAMSRAVLHGRIHADDWLEVSKQIYSLLAPDSSDIIDVTHRVVHQNGDILWLNARKQVKFKPGENGGTRQVVSGMVAIIDITKQKRAEEHAQFLLRELNHRSKNMLTIVQALAQMSFSLSTAANFLPSFTKRLEGLARNHDALATGKWEYASLTNLVNSHLSAFLGDISARRLTVEGPDICISPTASEAIGMALHELATNAVKYGALSNAEGTVHVSWNTTEKEDGSLALTWREQGGPSVSPPETAGFGQTVLTEMAAISVNGRSTLTYNPDGVLWAITVPKDEITNFDDAGHHR